MLAYTCSLLSLPLLLAVRRGLVVLAPRAEARLLFTLAVLPMLVSVAAVTASVVPAFSSVDHCVGELDLHDHPHLCAQHHAGSLPGGLPVFLGAFLLANLLLTVVQLLGNARVGQRLCEALGRAARAENGYGILPLAEPQAFLIGVLRPRLFLTEGLLATHREHLEVVLGHERAHLQFRHPLFRALAKAALCFHLPLISQAIERALTLSHEVVADEEAASQVGSRERVASALVQLTRAALPLHPAVTGFGCSHVELRIARLLDPPSAHDVPSARSLLLLSALALIALTIAAEPIHHGLELTLGLLGS